MECCGYWLVGQVVAEINIRLINRILEYFEEELMLQYACIARS